MSVPPLAVDRASKLWLLWKTMRPTQWAKNGLLFAGFIFAGRLRQPTGVAAEFAIVAVAFIAFCLLSSSTYLINDIHDIESDRAHPEKRQRPIASGRLSLAEAWGGAMLLILAAAVLIAVVTLAKATPWFPAVALAYVGLTAAYSTLLKHVAIVDVMALSLGFVIRVVAGCVAITVSISSWLLLCTFNLALFMSLCKRRSELLAFGDDSFSVRRVLDQYTLPLLDVLIAISAGASYMSYCLYTVLAPHQDFLGGDSPVLLVTVLPVFLGIGRYLYLVYRREAGGKPEDLLRDRIIAASVAFWIALVATLSRVGV
jgi:4-hydroxybenzoate polyprenyltransferase